jgi:uncharacterized membrane protein YeaQ/YmgE (transglycosylase-associated protein family)
MSLFTSLIVGGLIGWLARLLATGHARQNLFMSVVIGAMGALLSAWLISPLVGISASNRDNFNLMAVALAVGGAVGLLGIVDFARRMVSR